MKPDIELVLPARAENIAIVRHALGGFGEVFGISEEKLSDIRLAVTEACSNVVMHAYPEHPHRERRGRGGAELGDRPNGEGNRHIREGQPIEQDERASEQGNHPTEHAERAGGWGTMEVSATMVGDELAVVVRDWGEGIRPRPDSPGLGLGLSLIAALAQTVQLGHDSSEHTEVRMTFMLSDELAAGAEHDELAAGAEHDKLAAGAEHDKLAAGAEHDGLAAGAEQDVAATGVASTAADGLRRTSGKQA